MSATVTEADAIAILKEVLKEKPIAEKANKKGRKMPGLFIEELAVDNADAVTDALKKIGINKVFAHVRTNSPELCDIKISMIKEDLKKVLTASGLEATFNELPKEYVYIKKADRGERIHEVPAGEALSEQPVERKPAPKLHPTASLHPYTAEFIKTSDNLHDAMDYRDRLRDKGFTEAEVHRNEDKKDTENKWVIHVRAQQKELQDKGFIMDRNT